MPATAPTPIFAETGTLPWLTRKHGPFEAAITVRAKRLPTGVFPLRRARYALAMHRPRLSRRHRALRRCAVGRADECRPDHPPAADHHERGAAGAFRALGHPQGGHAAASRAASPMRSMPSASPSARRWATARRTFPLADHYASEGEEWMYGRGSHEKLTDSGDWREKIVLTEHRYMLEDMRIGLSFLASVGELAGVPTPLARAFLAIGSAICGEDFMRTGRTLASARPRPSRSRRPASSCSPRASDEPRPPSPASAPAAWRAASPWCSPTPAIASTIVDVKARDAADYARVARKPSTKCAARWRRWPPSASSRRRTSTAIAARVIRRAGGRGRRALAAGRRHLRRRAGGARTSSARCWRASRRSPARRPIIASTTSTILVDDLSGAVAAPGALPQRALAQSRPFWCRWWSSRPARAPTPPSPRG